MASLEILLPNGQVLAVQMYIDNGSGPEKWDGAVSVTPVVGGATEAKQDVGNTSLSSIDSKVPALPSTSGKQDTGNASLASIDAKDFATQTTLALIKAKTDNIPALGQALAASSVPIVLTAIQLAAITPPAAITGFATSAKQDTGNTSLANLDVALSTRTKPSDQQHVIVDSGVTTGLTDTQLRATPVPISGTVTITDGAGTLNVIVDSSALPALASTSTNQAAQITAEQAIQAAVEIIDNFISGSRGLVTEDNSLAISASLTSLVTGLLTEQDIASADITGPLIQGKVEDAASNGINLNTVHPLSLTSDGRLRVATAAESYNYTPWGNPNSWGTDGSTIENYPLSAW